MRPKDLRALGVPGGKAQELAARALKIAAQNGMKKSDLRQAINGVVENPAAHTSDSIYGALAETLIELKRNFSWPRTCWLCLWTLAFAFDFASRHTKSNIHIIRKKILIKTTVYDLVAFFYTLRQMGAVATPRGSPPRRRISNSCASSPLSLSFPEGQCSNFPDDIRFVHSQNPWPSYINAFIAVFRRLRNTNTEPENGFSSN